MTYPLVDYSNPVHAGFSSFDALLPHQQRAQLAFEGQLVHVSNLINQAKEHPHFTDDCGEYLRSALELAAALASARENGIESLCDYFVYLSNESEYRGGDKSDDWLDDSTLMSDYADVSAMVINYCRWLRETHLHDRPVYEG